LVSYYRMYPETPMPIRPDDEGGGLTPVRAVRRCEPLIAATQIGHLVYPPIDFVLQWDGADTIVQIEGIPEWIKLEKLYLPGYADFWKSIAPPDALSCLPTFLEAFPERGVVQVWTGLIATTDPGQHLWIRGVVNRGAATTYQVFEGIVATDWWTGPLFTNIQILKTDTPITFRRNTPFLQCISINRTDIDRAANDLQVIGIEGFRTELWDNLQSNSDRLNQEPPASYRRELRRRQ
jgi:hypothetical protein